MRKALQSKRWTIISLALVFAMLGGLIALGAMVYYRFDFYFAFHRVSTFVLVYTSDSR